jgi:hypothetical protein
MSTIKIKDEELLHSLNEKQRLDEQLQITIQ